RGAGVRRHPGRDRRRRRHDLAPTEMEPRRNGLGRPDSRPSGTGDGAHEGRERGARRQAGRVARRADRPGHVREDLPPQHAVRNCDRPRDDVRRVLRAAAAVEAMLENMAGLTDGVRDELTVYTTPLTGAYYFVPSTQSLRRWGAI